MMSWNDLYATFFDFQGRRCMVQVQPKVGVTPMLTAFGQLEGGPSGEYGGHDTIVLSLAAGQGNAGAIMLQEAEFEGAEQTSDSHLTVLYGGARLLFAFPSEDGEDETIEHPDFDA